MTPIEEKILDFIRKNPKTTTVDRIAKELNISWGKARYRLEKLVKLGVLKKTLHFYPWALGHSAHPGGYFVAYYEIKR